MHGVRIITKRSAKHASPRTRTHTHARARMKAAAAGLGTGLLSARISALTADISHIQPTRPLLHLLQAVVCAIERVPVLLSTFGSPIVFAAVFWLIAMVWIVVRDAFVFLMGVLRGAVYAIGALNNGLRSAVVDAFAGAIGNIQLSDGETLREAWPVFGTEYPDKPLPEGNGWSPAADTLNNLMLSLCAEYQTASEALLFLLQLLTATFLCPLATYLEGNALLSPLFHAVFDWLLPQAMPGIEACTFDTASQICGYLGLGYLLAVLPFVSIVAWLAFVFLPVIYHVVMAVFTTLDIVVRVVLALYYTSRVMEATEAASLADYVAHYHDAVYGDGRVVLQRAPLAQAVPTEYLSADAAAARARAIERARALLEREKRASPSAG